MTNNIMSLATGHWVDILSTVGGIPVSCLDNKHKPCPSCKEGRDRFRFDDIDGNGTWFCAHCGGKDGFGGGGNGMSLLMRVRGWDFKQAAAAVEGHLGISRPKRQASMTPKPIKPPVDAPPPTLNGATHQWRYTNAAGETLFWIQRVDKPKGGKLFRPRTWVDGTGWQGERGTGWPAPRPLYNLASLSDRPNAKVILCEGEKAADRAQELFPSSVAIAWPNGAQSVGKVDWSPLTGRSILLWPDNDDEGRAAMAKAASLIQGPAKLLTIDAPPDAPQKWDIADADWTPEQASAYVKENNREFTQPGELVEVDLAAIPERKAKPRGRLDSMPFRCIGFDRNTYFYLPEKAGQVVSLTPAQHTRNYLLTLAPLSIWSDLYGTLNEKTGEVIIDWTAAADALINCCIASGVYEPSHVRGRGAWSDANRVIVHLGNRLVVDGQSSPITKLPESFSTLYTYENSRPILGPGDTPLPDDMANKIKNISQSFKWETEANANLLLGWVVLAPVCGALDWRPHIWLTGSAGTGKTTILKLFIKQLLGGMYEAATGGTTEAGLRGQLRSDAIPVVFDELEQNEQKDKQIVQNILALARISSSEGGRIYKGTTSGGSNVFEIRSMFCVSSINVALVQRADLDRFCVLGLTRERMPEKEWNDLESRMLEICTEDTGRSLVARTVQQIPTIRKNARVLATALARRFGQRFGDQHGALLAGAWTLEPNGGGELTLDAALKWISQMSWDSREVDANDADEMKCFNFILQYLLPIPGGRRMSVLELAQMASNGIRKLDDGNGEEIAPILGRHGIKTFDGALAISNSSTNLQAILRDTPWSGGAYRQALKRIDGATASSGTVRFAGCGATRAVLVPFDLS
jgi:putative DNA primase/helicase